MITAKEARKITEESKAKVDVSSILDELGKAVEKNASDGLSKAFIIKTGDQLTKECKTIPRNINFVGDKLKSILEELGYATDIRINDRDPSSTEYRYKIEVSW